MINKLIFFSIENRFVVVIAIILLLFGAYVTAPFNWNSTVFERYPVPVDAIPDIGENQQIVFTRWNGHSPSEIEDQISWPLSSALLGIPQVKAIRSFSMFGFSSIYVIFEEDVEFYFSRTRILEKLASLPEGTLPKGLRPVLGPDSTSLGQVFWYTLEGQDLEGNPTGGWDLDELRSIQDWQVRFALSSVQGVSEVASVGGHVKEYLIETDPHILQHYNISLNNLIKAVRKSNIDIGAKTLEINRAEYVIRGIGFVQSIEDIENAVVKTESNISIRVKDIARVVPGPANRRGVLDKEGAEATGGVVVVRYGANPLTVISAIKEKIKEISESLPEKTVDGKISKVTIVPFYDRSNLIKETLGTLESALTNQILVTICVVIAMLLYLGGTLLISATLPLAIAVTFIAMKLFNIDANIVSLSGIAIAIGTIVDMGIVLNENILRHLQENGKDSSKAQIIFEASSEVGSAVLTAVATTIVSFLPVFTMEAAEGKLFKPLAFTKTFALAGSLLVALSVIPALSTIFAPSPKKDNENNEDNEDNEDNTNRFICSAKLRTFIKYLTNFLVYTVVIYLLTTLWMPLSFSVSLTKNFVFSFVTISTLIASFQILLLVYKPLLRWCLTHKILFLTIPAILVLAGFNIWQNLQEEFMPSFDEGSFLLMPTTMPNASIGECLDVLQKQDILIKSIPEVTSVAGKIGRVESPLDPAPLSMIETVINYSSQFIQDENGRVLTYKYNANDSDFFRTIDGEKIHAKDGKPYIVTGKFLRKDGKLIKAFGGKPFSLWRQPLNPDLNEGREPWPGIRKSKDIWKEIVDAAKITGTTSAPRLQPIETRIIMLQSGMRASLGIKLLATRKTTLTELESAVIEVEKLLKEIPIVRSDTVNGERITGKPYLEVIPDREKLYQYNLTVEDVLKTVEAAVGGVNVTTTIEGRQRFNVRVRFKREVRNSIESLLNVPVATVSKRTIPLKMLIKDGQIKWTKGPMVIKGDNGALVAYVIFDKISKVSEVKAVEICRKHLNKAVKNKKLILPPSVSFSFVGSWENHERSKKRLQVVLPVALLLIAVLLYFQFKSYKTTLIVFSAIVVAWSGGFIFIWLYGQPWFCNFEIWNVNLRELFNISSMNLSVAVWVGFIALFGIATDDGVIMATYLKETFAHRYNNKNTDGSNNDSETAVSIEELSPIEHRDPIQDIRETTIEAASKRVRPCLMTTATTLLALLPVLTSTGKGSDIMVPMSIPVFGGMAIEIITMFIVPVLYCLNKELEHWWSKF